MSELRCAPDLEPLLTPIAAVTRYPGNPKRHDLDTVRDSLTRYGYWRAIVVQQSTGRVLVGNGQHEAAESLGWGMIPVVELDTDDDDAHRIVMMDNHSGENGYDDLALAEALKALKATEKGLAGSGYTDEEFAVLMASLAADADTHHLDDDDFDDTAPGTGPRVYGVLITADTEREQAELVERFTAEGLTARPATA